jgi:hypothetical protein
MRRITGSTADAVLQALYPKTNDLLKRFEEVKAQANVADAERDRLRKYIQEHVPAGKYEDVILTKEPTAEQVYVNADGKHALKYATLVACEKPEAGIQVVLLRTEAPNAGHLASSMLKELQKSREHLVEWLEERVVGAGLTLDNDDLYSEKGGTKIGIVVLPQEVADGTPRAD